MFRIFRRIREEILLGKVARRYLGYAVGELILVVLGILIALQINNWNEERIEQRQILISKTDALAAYIEDRPFDELRNIDLFYLMRAPFYRPYAWNRNALEQIKSSGSLRQMTNRQLAEKISAYEAFTYHLEGDFDFDRAVGTKSVELAGTVIDMNYPSVYQHFPVDQLESFSFPNSPIHDVYVELPKLVADAQELIAMLKEEYPE
jgi:hypothetical protein